MKVQRFIRRMLAIALSIAMVVVPMPNTALGSTLPVNSGGEITAFEPLAEEIQQQSVALGTVIGELKLPEALTATVLLSTAGASESSEGVETVTPAAIEAGDASEVSTREEITSFPVTWSAEPEFDSELPGSYVFTPLLQNEYTLAEGVEAPIIFVTVGLSLNTDRAEMAEEMGFAALVSGTGWTLDNGLLTIESNAGMTNWLGKRAANINNVTSIVIQDGVSNIPAHSFSFGANLLSVSIPDSVTTIGAMAFGVCTALSSITLPKNLTSIGVEAFARCPFKYILIPSTVTSIGTEAFYAGGVETVVFQSATPPTAIEENIFIGCTKLKYIYVPNGSVGVYQAVPNLSPYVRLITVPLIPITNYTGLVTVTYQEASIDVFAVPGLFLVNANAGEKTFTIEDNSSGEGTINGSTLSVTRAGTFRIGLTTAPTATHGAGAKVTAILTVNKALQTAIPTGLGKTDATTYGGSDGKITGLAANVKYEYKKDGGSYLSATADDFGEIAGLVAGSYVVRLAETDLYSAGGDSEAVAIGQGKIPVENLASYATVVYQGTDMDLTAISGLFTVNSNAGSKVYTLENGGTGVGSIKGNALTVIEAGTFFIGLKTAETATHMAGSKVVAILTINKGTRAKLTGLGKTDATTYDGSDGKITGLTANLKYEYKKNGGSYTAATANSSGEITGLSAGSYVVRFAETDLYNVGTDSEAVTIGQGKIPVNNMAGSAAVTYQETTIDLTVISGLFTVDSNAGTKLYTVEEGGTGAGSIAGNSLTVTEAGTIYIGLTTTGTETHMPGSKVTAILTINKGTQAAPIGLGKSDATKYGGKDGKLTGLTANVAYEYKKDGDSYKAVTSNGSGEITGLSAGSYLVRLAETALYNAGENSDPVIIGQAKIPITNTAGSVTVTYLGTTFDVMDISALFIVKSYAGEKTFTLEADSSGAGTLKGSILTVTRAGTFRIGLTTAETAIYGAGAKVTATLTVDKGVQQAPVGLGKTDTTIYDANDGKITGLTANLNYEYKKDGGSYTAVTANSLGEITGLAAGAYVVRLAESDLYHASEDSEAVTIGQGKMPVNNSAGSATVTYQGTTIDVSAISGLFAVNLNAGSKLYTIEEGGTGAGSIAGNALTVTEAGTIYIGLTTAETETHMAGSKVTAILTINKGTRATLTGLGKTDATTYGGSDGKITGLTAKLNYEYKKNSGSYTTVTADSSGEITGLTAGSYVVRFAETELYNAGADSDAVTIGQADAPVYGIVLIPSGNKVFEEKAPGYGIIEPYNVTVTNTGNQPSGALSIVLSGVNAGDFTLSTDTLSDISASEAGSFTLAPKQGLSAGSYTATVTISRMHELKAAFEVSFTVKAVQSHEKDIKGITAPSGAVVNETSITASVINNRNSQTINLAVSEGASWQLFNDPDCRNEIENKTMTLNVGINTAYVKVTAEDGTIRVYTLNITREGSNSGGDPGNGTGGNSGNGTGGNSGNVTGGNSGNGTGGNSGNGTGGNSGNVTGGNSGNGTGVNSGSSTGSDPENSSGSATDSAGVKKVVPVTGTTENKAVVDSKGNAKVSVTDKNIAAAIEIAKAEAVKKGVAAGEVTVSVNVSTGGKNANTVTVNLPISTQLEVISNKIAGLELTIERPDIVMGLNNAAISEINRQAKADVQLTATKTDSAKLGTAAKNAIEGRPAFDFKASYQAGAGSVTNFGKGSVYVSIPYTPAKNEKPVYLYAVYVDKKGKVTRVPGSAYDANTQSIIFTTNHFSIYGISYTDPTVKFKDTGSHWAKDSIDYVTGRGLLTGTSKTAFSPNAAMTRGMLVTALGRLAGVNKADYKTNTFSDVKSNSAVRPYIEWAYQKGIFSKTGDNKFEPNRAITREETALIFANYAKATGYNLPSIREITVYADASSIGDTYKAALTATQQAGIMMGAKGNKFNPKSKATRAEVSVMLHRYIKLIIDVDTANGWALNDAGQYLYYKEGKVLTGKQTMEGVTYFFETSGTLKTGWVKDQKQN